MKLYLKYLNVVTLTLLGNLFFVPLALTADSTLESPRV